MSQVITLQDLQSSLDSLLANKMPPKESPVLGLWPQQQQQQQQQPQVAPLSPVAAVEARPAAQESAPAFELDADTEELYAEATSSSAAVAEDECVNFKARQFWRSLYRVPESHAGRARVAWLRPVISRLDAAARRYVTARTSLATSFADHEEMG